MSLPLLRLNSLELLRGFVAVGRRMSMTQAAEDLCLTQSAISKQVRALEASVGVRLFRRGHRSIAFTAEGERLFRSADAALQQLQDALGALQQEGVRQPVTITSAIGVAGLWLLPRLGQFQVRHPEVDVRVAAHNRVLDLRAEGVDLALRYAAEAGVDQGATRLFGDSVAPVASPRLGLRRLDARALATVHLLEFDERRRPWLTWKSWLQARGWDAARPKGILHFNQYDQIIQAAVAGQGVALGRMELLAPMLADGRLVELAAPGERTRSHYAYWLIQAEAEPRREVRLVADWLRAEAAAEEAAAA